MPLSASKRELLTQRVVFNHEILTHRIVARSFKVHTKEAKALLREFHEASDGRTHATHVVTGYVKPDLPYYSQQGADQATHINGNGVDGGVSSSLDSGASSSAPPLANGNGALTSEVDGTMQDAAAPSTSQPAYVTELHARKEDSVTEIQCIMLIPEDELEARLPTFTRVLSNEIYSVEPSKLPDLVLLTDANAPVLADPDLAAVDGAVIGTIAHSRGSAAASAGKKSKSAKASTSTSKSGTSQPDLKRKASSSDVSTTSGKATSSKPTTSSKLSTSTTASSAKATSPVISKDKDKKGKEKEKSATPSLNDMFSKSNASAAADKGKKADAVVTDKKGRDKGKGKDAMDVDGEEKRDGEEDEYGDMMLDDDDLMAEIDGLENGKVSTKKSPAATKAKASTDKSANMKDEGSKKKALQSNKPRKIRTITKKVIEKNAKGFKVTREVETDESYSGSDDNDEEDSVVVASSSTTSNKPKKTAEKQEVKPKKEKESTPAAATPSSTAGGGAKKKNTAKPGEQSSLASFFGKPKATGKK